MITKFLLGLALASWFTATWAADTFHPLDVKPGEWESSMTLAGADAPPIPPEALARLTPQQRARLEEQTKSLSSRTIVRKSCVKKEKLDKPIMWGHEDSACTYTLGASTGSLQEIHTECSRGNTKSSGTIRVQALSPESIKGSVEMTITTDDKSISRNSSFTAKWIGAACSNGN